MILSIIIIASINTASVAYPDVCGNSYRQTFDNNRISRQNAQKKLCDKTYMNKLAVPKLAKPIRRRNPKTNHN